MVCIYTRNITSWVPEIIWCVTYLPLFFRQISIRNCVSCKPLEIELRFYWVLQDPVSEHARPLWVNLLGLCEVRWICEVGITYDSDAFADLPASRLELVLPIVSWLDISLIVSPLETEARFDPAQCLIFYAETSQQCFIVIYVRCRVLKNCLHDEAIRVVGGWVIWVLFLVGEAFFWVVFWIYLVAAADAIK